MLEAGSSKARFNSAKVLSNSLFVALYVLLAQQSIFFEELLNAFQYGMIDSFAQPTPDQLANMAELLHQKNEKIHKTHPKLITCNDNSAACPPAAPGAVRLPRLALRGPQDTNGRFGRFPARRRRRRTPGWFPLV